MKERFEWLAVTAARRPWVTLAVVGALAIGGGLLALRTAAIGGDEHIRFKLVAELPRDL